MSRSSFPTMAVCEKTQCQDRQVKSNLALSNLEIGDLTFCQQKVVVVKPAWLRDDQIDYFLRCYAVNCCMQMRFDVGKTRVANFWRAVCINGSLEAYWVQSTTHKYFNQQEKLRVTREHGERKLNDDTIKQRLPVREPRLCNWSVSRRSHCAARVLCRRACRSWDYLRRDPTSFARSRKSYAAVARASHVDAGCVGRRCS